MKQLWIVQPYVPSYRVPFFELLASSLTEDGIEMHVVAGQPQGAQAQRGDGQSPEWLVHARGREVHAMGRTITLTSTRKHWRKADGVIVPHMGSSMDALAAIAGRANRRVGLWGHIAPYTSEPNPVDLAVERWQLRRAHQVFAYTPGGAAFAEQAGVNPARITTVMNTVDTAQLRDEFLALKQADVEAFRREHELGSDPVVSYIGGLDSSKRIDMLADALAYMWEREERVRVLVGGDGQDAHLLDHAIERGQVVRLGVVGVREKALMGRVSSAIVCPGRIGLIAVEALTFGLPIVTSDWPYHAPEREYLVPDRDVIYANDNASAFASALVGVLRSGSGANRLSSEVPQLSDMVGNFRSGILRLLS